MQATDAETVRDRLEATFWTRHANPWSAGRRFLTVPLLAVALYRRDRRLLAATLAFVAVNPVLFPPPDRTDSYPSRVVLAEHEWLARGNGTVGLGYPNVLNLLNVFVTLYALVAALRRDPLGTAVGTVCVMGLKLWWVDAVLRRTGVTGDAPARAARTDPLRERAESGPSQWRR